jgi:hypothetical protein
MKLHPKVMQHNHAIEFTSLRNLQIFFPGKRNSSRTFGYFRIPVFELASVAGYPFRTVI